MINLSKPYFDEKELNIVKETLQSGWVAGQGPKGKELEESIKEYLKVNYVIPVSNCTAGLHLALSVLNIKQGDEVIVSDYTFPAAGYAVLYCGAKPRFADVKINSCNIDPNCIEPLINKKTKAIIVVHQFGLMADMNPIMEIADKYGVSVIEDAACSIGAKYYGNMVGSFGIITTFSLHARKNITSGEGGLVVTNNKDYAETIKSLSCFGMKSALKREKEFSIPEFSLLGYNYKLSDINSAIAIEQLKKYSVIEKRTRQIAKLYHSLLADNQFITLPVEEENYLHTYQTYSILLDARIDRNKMILKLREKGIQTNIGTYACHIQPVYKSLDKCPNSLHLYNHSISLPLHYSLTDEEVVFVAEKLNEYLKGE